MSDKNFYKFSAWAGVTSLLVFFLSWFIQYQYVAESWTMWFVRFPSNLLVPLLVIPAFLSLAAIGKSVSKKLLVIASWTTIIYLMLSTFLYFSYVFAPYLLSFLGDSAITLQILFPWVMTALILSFIGIEMFFLRKRYGLFIAFGGVILTTLGGILLLDLALSFFGIGTELTTLGVVELLTDNSTGFILPIAFFFVVVLLFKEVKLVSMAEIPDEATASTNE